MTPRLSVIASSIRKALGGLSGDIGKSNYADEYWNSVVLSLRGNVPVQDFKTETVLNMHMDGADPDWANVVLGMHMGGGEVDPYWSNVSLLMLMNGTNASTAIGDVTGKTVTVAENAAISTTQSKFGGSSCYFDGTGDYLTAPHSTELSMGSGDFTIECWVRPSSVSVQQNLINKQATLATDTGYLIRISSAGLPGFYAGDSSTGWDMTIQGPALSINTWYHIAGTRSGNTFSLWLNGVLVGTATSSITIHDNANSLYIGSNTDGSTYQLNSYIDNVRITKGVARYTDTFTPPNREFPAGATTIYDVKGHPVTVAGNTAIVTTQSRFGGYSCYFDGTGDYLTADHATDWVFGTGDFTIEFWVYPTAFATNHAFGSGLIDTRGIAQGYSGITLFANTSGVITVYNNNGSAQQTPGGTLVTGRWQHVACSRASGTLRLYIDGVSVGSFASSFNYVGQQLTIANVVDYRDTGVNFKLAGYIDDLLITKGVARYTASFTPPSRAFPHDVAFYDEKGLVPTLTGTPTVSTATLKYGYGSASFNGTTDYLTFDANAGFGFGTGDFTLEAWVKTSAAGTLLDFRNYASDYGHFYLATGGYLAFDHTYGAIVGTTVVTDNNWHHVAFVRYNNILTMFVDGADSGAAIANANIGSNRQARIGAKVDGTNFFAGNIDQLRLTKVARYVGEFTPQKYMFEDANNNVIWRDETGTKTVTANGGAQVYTGSYKYGNGSIYLDGAGDYLTVPANSDFDFGAGDFTWEVWIYRVAVNDATYADAIWCSAVSPVGFAVGITPSGKIGICADQAAGDWGIRKGVGPGDPAGSITVTLNAWHHIAITRSGSSWIGFVDGVVDQTFTNSGTITDAPGGYFVGHWHDGWTRYFNGYLDDLRITKGIARYVSTFTPPTRQNANYGLPAVVSPVKTHLDPHYDSVVLNMHMNGPSGSAAFVDEKGKIITAYGNAALSSTQSKFGGVSAYFDGTGDYLSFASSSDFGFGTADFTIEGWIYISGGQGTDRNITDFRSASGNDIGTFFIDGPTNKLAFWYGTKIGATGTALTTSTWYHVVLCRASGVTFCFLNGVLDWSSSASINFGSSRLLSVGASMAAGIVGNDPFAGYIDDLRITKGIARYTSNFTVPALPNPDFKTPPAATDPYWKNVVLHMPMNGADAGTTFTESTGKTVTVVGNTSTQVEQYRFGGSSAFCDADGDYLTVATTPNLGFSTGDFTVELWYMPSAALTGNRILLDFRVSAGNSFILWCSQSGAAHRPGYSTEVGTSFVSGGAWTTGAWQHIALVRASGTVTCYVNGASVFSTTDSRDFGTTQGLYIGSSLTANQGCNGYIDDVRVTKGVARYTANFTPPSLPNPTGYDPYAPNVVLHLPMNTDFTDGTGKTVTVSGNTVISTTTKKFGAGSGYFDGSGDYLTTTNSADFDLSGVNSTVEAWINLSNTSGDKMIAGFNNTSASNFWDFRVSGSSLVFRARNSGVDTTISGGALVSATWYHVAAVRSGTAITLYLNGVSVATNASVTIPSIGSSTLGIGANLYFSGYEFYFNGYIDDLRITKGVARYTANFTPPREPFSLT